MLYGLPESISEYYIAKNEQNKYAIFYKDNPKEPISGWWNEILENGLVNNESGYYVVRNEQFKYAIFHLDNPDKPVSQWWWKMYWEGLTQGKTDYYIAVEDDQFAIFHKDNATNPISNWYDRIYKYGLAQGDSDYYIAFREGRGEAIFHKDNKNQPISQWWDYIVGIYGLVKGQSNYYIARSQSEQCAIFHKDNEEPLSGWHIDICPIGLVNGTSQYYAVVEPYSSLIQVYCNDDMFYPLYEVPKRDMHPSDIGSILYINSDSLIYVKNGNLMIYDALAKKSDILFTFSNDVVQLMRKEYEIHKHDTSRLIARYVYDGFMPIVINNQCYLYTTYGNLVGKFRQITQAEDYMQSEIMKKNKNADMIRLY